VALAYSVNSVLKASFPARTAMLRQSLPRGEVLLPSR
jgi:hypothetical protein